MQLPFPLNPPNGHTVLITDTAQQSSTFLELDCEIHYHSKSLLLNTTSVQLVSNEVNHIQRDLLTELTLSKLLYNVDMAIHLSPNSSTTINSAESCRVEWWRKSRSGKVETGRGVLKKANNQLVYTSDKQSTQPASMVPSSTFNLSMTERQVEQRASSAFAPHSTLTVNLEDGPLPGFDSDDPDADLDL